MGSCIGMGDRSASRPTLRIAFVGNSFTFYNDMPHLVQAILSQHVDLKVGACLHGAQSFSTLWTKGADMDRAYRCLGHKDMYPTVKDLFEAPEGWDAIVLQDNSQSPARPEKRDDGLKSLREQYIPCLLSVAEKTGKKPLVLMYSTWGYVSEKMKTPEIGDFKKMSRLTSHGYYQYASALEEKGFRTDFVQCGAAFESIHDRDEALWQTLYQPDLFHPTPKASYLIAALFAVTLSRHFSFAGQFSPGGALPIDVRWPAGIVPAGPAMSKDDPTKQENGDTPNLEVPAYQDIEKVLQAAGGLIP